MANRKISLLPVLLLTSLGISAQIVERTFYIDYGQNNVTNQGFLTTGADANGHHWTNVHGRGTGAPDKAYPQTVQLVSSDGTPTDCAVQLSSRFSTNGYSNGGLNNPSKTLLGELAVQTATQDYIFLEGQQDYSVINFRGLDPAKAYRFHTFGSRTATDERAATLDFCGENRWKGELVMSGTGVGANGYTGNNNKILASEPVFPDRDGVITLTISKKTSGSMVYINCMKIEEITGLARPNQELSLVQKVYVDFGETNNSTRGHQTTRDTNGNRWNNVTSGSSTSNQISASKAFTLYNSEAKSTGMRLTVIEKSYTNGIDAGGNNNPSADDLGDLAVKTATEDYMFIDNGDARSFKLTKLKTDHLYRLYIYGTRNTTSDRATLYSVQGQSLWRGGQTTSGSDIGGEGVHGNMRNILVSDYLWPDRNGELLVTMQRVFGMAHISAMRIEEYEGSVRPEDPLAFTSLRLTGNAEEVSFKPTGNNCYEAYAQLTPGSYRLEGVSDGKTITLTDGGDGHFAVDGETPFAADKEQVVRITVNTAEKNIVLLPVKMYVRGNMGAGSPVIPYKGQGVFEGQVTLRETTSQQWVDKTMWFALNNNDAYAIKRRPGAATRYDLGEAEKGEGTENIYQNAGTYTITVDMNKKVYAIDAPVDEFRVSVFGSSVANGQGATDYKGYRYLYGQQLINRYKTKKSDYPFYTTNVSIGGNTTTNLLDRYDDLIRDFGRYVIFGLSLGNEGIHGSNNQEGVFAQWRDNMLKLIQKVRADGKIPMVMNNYTRSDYDENDYYYVKKLNLLIHEWDVPSTNVLGSIDNGHGQWADGYVSDTYHQNTAGHQEFMYAMVPSLYDALKEGKPQPKRNTSKSMTLVPGCKLVATPEGTMHPFTVTLRVKGTEGQLLAIAQASSSKLGIVRVNADGTVTYTEPGGASVTSTATISDGKWHYVTLTSYYAQKRTILYIDKEAAGEIGKRISTIKSFTVGDDKAWIDMSEFFLWRSGMTPEEIAAVCSGKMLKSSLEIYTPLAGKDNLPNLAQSTNALQFTGDEETAFSVPYAIPKQDEAPLYNLAGQRLSHPIAGLNIQAGRKFMKR